MEKPIINHVWSGAVNGTDTARRWGVAHATWNREREHCSRWRDLKIDADKLPKNASTAGDDASLPYIHDMIEAGLPLQDTDIIVITNADIGIYRGFSDEVTSLCTRFGACFAHRWDFKRIDKPLETKQDIAGGKWYVGADAFAFTRKWWNANKADYPPFVLGRETWDWILREKIKETGGKEMMHAIFHEVHDAAWKHGRQRLAGNIYNRSFARAWLTARKMPLREIARAPFNPVTWPPPKWVQHAPAVSAGSIDVLMVLGKGSKWNNMELRYCLRSLEKYAKGMGNLWVVGQDPGFLSQEVYSHFRPDAGHNKEHNIAEQIMYACEKPGISENFFWINDDTFLMEDTDITTYPYYCQGVLERKWQKTQKNGYRIALAQTDAQLRARMMTSYNFEVHVPIIYNKTKFRALKKWLDISAKVPYGLTFRSIYCNVNKIPQGPGYTDLKIGESASATDFQSKIEGRHAISLGDGLSDAAKAYIDSLFPLPSRYEKSCQDS